MGHYLVLLVIALIPLIPNYVVSNDSPASCKIYNIGDSNTDAGFFCNDEAYYGPRCRTSDDKVYVDYFCDWLNIDLLPCYKGNSINITSGANFAVWGAKIQAGDKLDNSSLSVQVERFERLQNQTYQEAMAAGKWPSLQQEFRNAIYSIDIGVNDCLDLALNYRTTYQEKTPSLVGKIEEAVNKLYELGGRKFVIYNAEPLSYINLAAQNSWDEIYNDVVKAFNKDLNLMCDKLRSYRKDAIIIYGDMFTVKLDLSVNFSKYGFSSGGHCHRATNGCNTVFWDGYHYSDKSNKLIATKLWTGEYWSPNNKNMHDLCEVVM